MSSDNAITVENISKCYRTYSNPANRLRQMMYSAGGRLPLSSAIREKYKNKAGEMGQNFWALKNVSFEIKRGQTMGILGRNGAGKSTLLQLITGTTSPTHGNITTQGKVAALLELGSGFNHSFTGLENIYLNASLLGLSREETDKKLDDILSFADIGNFIHKPIRTYSSGMVVRLAFAVQAQLEPEIFIIDEALAVGDAKFQAKCFARLKKLVESGTTILFVSHSTEQVVTHCDSAILLENGEVLESGKPRQVVNRYLDLLFGKNPVLEESTSSEENDSTEKKPLPSTISYFNFDRCFSDRPYYNASEYRWGDKAAEFVDFIVRSKDQDFPHSLEQGEKIQFAFKVKFKAPVARPIFGFTLKTKEGVTIYGTNSELQNSLNVDMALAGEELLIKVDMPIHLASGDYFISVGIASRQLDQNLIPHDRRYDSIHIKIAPTPHFFGLADLQTKIYRLI